jgi:hypothetical protein
VRLKKKIFLLRKNALAYYSAGVVAVNSKVVGLAPAFRRFHQARGGFDHHDGHGRI